MFYNNITLALIPDDTWRSDYSQLYIKYFQNKIAPNIQSIMSHHVDEALGACTTDFLLVCRAGTIIFAPEFFTALDTREIHDALFIGQIKLRSDYATLNDSLLLVNMVKWREYGQPQFNSKVRQGPIFYVSNPSSDRYTPNQIVKQSDEQVYVDNICSSNGAAFIVESLNRDGSCSSFMNHCDDSLFYFLDSTTPYHELVTETRFEKKYLSTLRSRVPTIDTDDLSSAESTVAGIVVAPAIGLKAHTLAEHYKAKHVVVFSDSGPALELQKLIFSTKNKVLYGDIIHQFCEDHSNKIEGGWQEDEYAIISPLPGVTCEFILVDPFSYEMENMIKQLDFQSSMVFDFSDIYVRPHHYYKRNVAQVRGLFEQLWSHLKSRTGPVKLFGVSPDFAPLDSKSVNTSNTAFLIDASRPPAQVTEPEPELTQELLDSAAESNGLINSILIQEDTMKVNELFEDKKHPTKHIDDEAKEHGFEKSHRTDKVDGEKIKFTVYTKQEEYADLAYVAELEYKFNPETGAWQFLAGKANEKKRVEFHNGEDEKSLIKHLSRKMKFNPKTALQYF